MPLYKTRASAPTIVCCTSACATALRRSAVCLLLFARVARCSCRFIGAEFMPHLDEGSLWVRATMPYTISFEEASKLGPQMREPAARASRRSRQSRTSSGRDDEGTDPIGFFNDEYFVGLKPYGDAAWRGIDPDEGAAHRRDPAEARRLSRDHLQLHAAGRGCGGRGRDRAEELARRQDFRVRPGNPRDARPKRCAKCWPPCPASPASPWCASSDSRA